MELGRTWDVFLLHRLVSLIFHLFRYIYFAFHLSFEFVLEKDLEGRVVLVFFLT